MTVEPPLPTARDLAIGRFQSGDYEGSGRLLLPLLSEHQNDALLHRLHGMCLVRTGLPLEGLGSLARSTFLAPDDAVCATWHGIGLHAAGRYDEAARVLAAAAALAPQDPTPLIHASRALLQTGRAREALAAAKRASLLASHLLEADHAKHLATLAVLQADEAKVPADLASAWTELGRSCLRLDKVAEARAAFAEALLLQSDHAVALCELALIDHLSGQPTTAVARLRCMLDCDPGCYVVRSALASRLLLGGDAAEALALLDAYAAPSSGPPLSRLHLERAQALIALRRDEDADRALEHAATLPVRALELLFTWQRFILAARRDQPEASDLLTRIERLTERREAGSLEQRIDSHFDLADLHHKASRHDKAFTHWQRGHSLLRLAQPFSRDAHERYLAAIIRNFGAARFAEGRLAGTMDPLPVFIVGLPRTGTTLLEQILSAHPAVHGAGERLAIRETLMRLTGTAEAGLAMERAAALDAATLTAMSRNYVDELRALAPGASRVLDKMPDNIFQLGFIATLLPGARIICCTRDLRDVGFSIFRHRFIGHHPYAHDLSDLGCYMTEQQRLLAHWQACLPSPILVLDHADWIADFDSTLRRVLAFLDLPYDPACERFFEQDRRIGSASRAQVRRPINADGVGRWRDYAAQLGPMLRELSLGA